MNNVTTTLSDEEMIKTKVVDLDKFYNFYVHDFLAEIIYCSKMTFEVAIFLKFKIKIDKNTVT